MRIPASHGHLEATLREAAGPLRGAAVLCHPHPLHGGTLHTKAVFRTAQALSDAGFHALRFNFRGVGTSTGEYDEGKGEREDVRDALSWLSDRHPGLPLLVGGFSFGAVVGLRAGADDDRVRGLVGIGLPLGLYGPDAVSVGKKPLLVVQGEEDEFGGGDVVAAAVDGLGSNVTLVRIAGAGHFFDGRFDELRAAIGDHFTRGAGAELFPPTGD